MLATSSLYAEVLNHFTDKHCVTIATGATCAYLGDERNLREFLVADETARWLRRAGHGVIFFLIDDTLDPLKLNQLRVAVNKDEKLIEKYQHWCGKPISHLPDPWQCHESYSDHFEEELLHRLQRLECHPTLIRTAKLYQRGVYTPYVRTVLDRHDEILEFLSTRFQGYNPEKLFWVLCPGCGYINQTDIEHIGPAHVKAYCHHCERSTEIPRDELQGKLNWKLDCAARWAIFGIDAEPFSKSYMEPQSGSFYIAQTLCQEFFGGQSVFPLAYGMVKMDRKLSYKLMDSLPSTVFRSLMVERPATEIALTRDLVVTAASRYVVLPGLSYLDFIKQLLPMWLLSPDLLTPSQRELVAQGISFGKNFLNVEPRLHLPTRQQIETEQPAVLRKVHSLLAQIIDLREEDPPWEQFQEPVKQLIDSLGVHKGPALHRLRLLAGQEQGLPVARFLFVLPLEYLRLVEYMLDLSLKSAERDADTMSAQESMLAVA